MKICILGGGNMGRALAGGLIRRGTEPSVLSIGESHEPTRLALARDLNVTATADNLAAISGAGVVVIAVKPQDVASVLAPLAPQLSRERPLLLSVAAGIRTESLQSWCGPDVPIVRAMPNRPALVGAGATGLYAPASVSASAREQAASIMGAVGEVVWVSTEEALDVVTALSGSGPAYFFLLAELMADAAVSLGLEPDAAKRLAIATLHGSGLLAHSSDGDLARLREQVTSKGGTTEAALRAFNEADLRAIVARALTAAARRSQELAAQFGTDSSRTGK